MEVGEDIGGIHECESGAENIKVGRDVGGICDTRTDAQGIEVGKEIGDTQQIANNTKILIFHVAKDVNATPN